MRVKMLLKWGFITIGLACLASCSMAPGARNEGTSAFGLGQFGRFAGQEAGESYTTRAPQNQIYLFDYDDSSVNPKYEASVYSQAEYLKSHPNARILLAGHTDEKGSREYNIALGERRALKVAELMSNAGVEREQVRYVSYGKERPANLGHDEASRKQNRRVELIYEVTR